MPISGLRNKERQEACHVPATEKVLCGQSAVLGRVGGGRSQPGFSVGPEAGCGVRDKEPRPGREARPGVKSPVGCCETSKVSRK